MHVSQGTLVAYRFDPNSGAVSGSPVSVAQNVSSDGGGAAGFGEVFDFLDWRAGPSKCRDLPSSAAVGRSHRQPAERGRSAGRQRAGHAGSLAGRQAPGALPQRGGQPRHLDHGTRPGRPEPVHLRSGD